jgi:hypothetical protein
MLLKNALSGIAVALLAVAQPALAQQPPKAIGTPSSAKPKVSSLIVLNAAGARLNGNTLVLERPQEVAILFSDRPVRSAGHMPTVKMVELWKTGSFAKDPPNATVSVFTKAGTTVSDVVLVLKQPRLDGGNLAFDVSVLEGSLTNADGPATVFIDTLWWSFGSDGFTYLGANEGQPPPDPPRYSGPSNELYTPPEIRANPYPRAACGAPPLLPCY